MKLRILSNPLVASGCVAVDTAPMTLGELVKTTRVEKGWTQSDVAQRVGVETKTIANIEAGRTRSLKTTNLRSLAQAIEIPLADVLAAAKVSAENVSVPVARELADRVAPYAAATRTDLTGYVEAALEALMRLQGSPDEIANGTVRKNGAKGKPRIMGTRAASDRIAAKESKDQD